MKKNILLSIVLLQIIVLNSCFKSPSSPGDIPQNLIIPPGAVTESTISLLWEKPINTKQEVFYAIYKGGTVIDTVSLTNYIVSGLIPDHTYEFYVKAIYPNGKLSIKSNEVIQSTKRKGEVFNITDYGAVGNGIIKNTNAIQKAIDDCTPGGVVYIPKGIFLSGALFFKSNMTLYIEEGGVLKGTTEIRDYYPLIWNRFEGWELKTFASLINAGRLDHEGDHNCQNLSIRGKGTISGGGQELAEAMIKAEGLRGRGRLICLMNCKNVNIHGLSIQDSPCWTIHYIYCKNVTCHDLYIKSTVKNGDGIDPDSSIDSYIYNCTFSNTDDCIAIKSGKNPEGFYIGKPTENVLVANCNFISGHGMSIGSEMSGGVKNVIIRDCHIGNLLNGLQIKVTKDRGGYVENIKVTNCILNKIKIITSVNYNNDGEPAPKLPYLKDMEFSNLDMSNGSGNAKLILVDGYPGVENYTRDIVFKNIRLPELSVISLNYCKNINFNNVVSGDIEPIYKITNSLNINK